MPVPQKEPEIIYPDIITDKIKKILIPYPTAEYVLDNVSFESLLKYCKSGLLAIVTGSSSNVVMDCIGYSFEAPDALIINMLDNSGTPAFIQAVYNSGDDKVSISEYQI